MHASVLARPPFAIHGPPIMLLIKLTHPDAPQRRRYYRSGGHAGGRGAGAGAGGSSCEGLRERPSAWQQGPLLPYLDKPY